MVEPITRVRTIIHQSEIKNSHNEADVRILHCTHPAQPYFIVSRAAGASTAEVHDAGLGHVVYLRISTNAFSATLIGVTFGHVTSTRHWHPSDSIHCLLKKTSHSIAGLGGELQLDS